jgi:hypothetical protein
MNQDLPKLFLQMVDIIVQLKENRYLKRIGIYYMNEKRKSVKELLQECYDSINDMGDLPSWKRKEIYDAIELHSNKIHENLVYYRRAKLELICAKKNFDKWNNCPLTDELGKELLELAENCLLGKAERKELEEKSNDFYTIVDDLMSEGEEYLVIAYAGFACDAAIKSVLYDIDLDILDTPEIERDPEEWTACFNACNAYSNSKSWKLDELNISRRQEFWTWFLETAIPAVLDSYPI